MSQKYTVRDPKFKGNLGGKEIWPKYTDIQGLGAVGHLCIIELAGNIVYQ